MRCCVVRTYLFMAAAYNCGSSPGLLTHANSWTLGLNQVRFPLGYAPFLSSYCPMTPLTGSVCSITPISGSTCSLSSMGSLSSMVSIHGQLAPQRGTKRCEDGAERCDTSCNIAAPVLHVEHASREAATKDADRAPDDCAQMVPDAAQVAAALESQDSRKSPGAGRSCAARKDISRINARAVAADPLLPERAASFTAASLVGKCSIADLPYVFVTSDPKEHEKNGNRDAIKPPRSPRPGDASRPQPSARLGNASRLRLSPRPAVTPNPQPSPRSAIASNLQPSPRLASRLQLSPRPVDASQVHPSPREAHAFRPQPSPRSADACKPPPSPRFPHNNRAYLTPRNTDDRLCISGGSTPSTSPGPSPSTSRFSPRCPTQVKFRKVCLSASALFF